MSRATNLWGLAQRCSFLPELVTPIHSRSVSSVARRPRGAVERQSAPQPLLIELAPSRALRGPYPHTAAVGHADEKSHVTRTKPFCVETRGPVPHERDVVPARGDADGRPVDRHHGPRQIDLEPNCLAAMRVPDLRLLAEPVKAPTFREAARAWQASRKDVREATAIQHRTSLHHVNRLLDRRDAITWEDVQRMIDDSRERNERGSRSESAGPPSLWCSTTRARLRTRLGIRG